MGKYLNVVVPGNSLTWHRKIVIYNEHVNEKDTTQIQCLTYSRKVGLIILSSAQILKQGHNNEKPKKEIKII